MHPRHEGWPRVHAERQEIERELQEIDRRFQRVARRLPPLPRRGDRGRNAYETDGGPAIPFDLMNAAQEEMASLAAAARRVARQMITYRGVAPDEPGYDNNSYRDGFRDLLPRARAVRKTLGEYVEALEWYRYNRTVEARRNTGPDNFDEFHDVHEHRYERFRAQESAIRGVNRRTDARPPGGHRRDAERVTDVAADDLGRAANALHAYDDAHGGPIFGAAPPDPARVPLEQELRRANAAHTQAQLAERATAYAPPTGFPAGSVLPRVQGPHGELTEQRVPDDVAAHIRRFAGMGWSKEAVPLGGGWYGHPRHPGKAARRRKDGTYCDEHGADLCGGNFWDDIVSKARAVGDTLANAFDPSKNGVGDAYNKAKHDVSDAFNKVKHEFADPDGSLRHAFESPDGFVRKQLEDPDSEFRKYVVPALAEVAKLGINFVLPGAGTALGFAIDAGIAAADAYSSLTYNTAAESGEAPPTPESMLADAQAVVTEGGDAVTAARASGADPLGALDAYITSAKAAGKSELGIEMLEASLKAGREQSQTPAAETPPPETPPPVETDVGEAGAPATPPPPPPPLSGGAAPSEGDDWTAARDSYKPAGTPPGWTQLPGRTPTVVAYASGPDTLIGIRGTATAGDVATWPTVATNTLDRTGRYKNDLLTVQRILASRPANGHVYFTGHSLGSAIGLQLQRDLKKQIGNRWGGAVYFNGALEPKDLLGQLSPWGVRAKEVYQKRDPLYNAAGGRLWRNAQVVDTPASQAPGGPASEPGALGLRGIQLPVSLAAHALDSFNSLYAASQQTGPTGAPPDGALSGGARSRRPQGHRQIGFSELPDRHIRGLATQARDSLAAHRNWQNSAEGQLYQLAEQEVGPGYVPDIGEPAQFAPGVYPLPHTVPAVPSAPPPPVGFANPAAREAWERMQHSRADAAFHVERQNLILDNMADELEHRNVVRELPFRTHVPLPGGHHGERRMGVDADGRTVPVPMWHALPADVIRNHIMPYLDTPHGSGAPPSAKRRRRIYGGDDDDDNSRRPPGVPDVPAQPGITPGQGEDRDLTDGDMKALAHPARVVTYANIETWKRIPDGATVLLLLTGPAVGHWLGLIRHGNSIEYFDPYGKPPDADFSWLSPETEAKLGESRKALTQLLDEAKAQGAVVTYNRHRLQSWAPNVQTCGRHVGARLASAARGLTLDQHIAALGANPDAAVTAWSENVLGH